MTDFLDEIEVHIPALRRYARALTRNTDWADDLVQDCLERALRKRFLWRPSGTLKSWLFRMLLNVYRNDRKRQYYRTHEDIDTLPQEPSSQPNQLDRLALQEISVAMTKLPSEQHEVLLLVVLEGMSYAETAKILGIPNGTVMSRLGRARANLKKMTTEAGQPKLRAVK